MLIGGVSSLSFTSFIVSETTREFNVDFLHTQTHLCTLTVATPLRQQNTTLDLLYGEKNSEIQFVYRICKQQAIATSTGINTRRLEATDEDGDRWR